MLKFFIVPFFLAFAAFLALPHIFYSPGYAVVKTCHITKIGPNAPQGVTLPPECANGGGNAKVIELAKAQLGDNYAWGTPNRRWADAGPDPKTFDCSGLVGWAWFNATGGKVAYPGSTKATWPLPPAGFQVIKTTNPADMQPGDPIYFGPSDPEVHHVGLFLGQGECGQNDCFIHAPRTGDVVKIESLSTRKDILGVVRPPVL